MSRIHDIKLAAQGHKRIDWVRSYMPLLRTLEQEFQREKPLADVPIAVSIHLEAKTAYLCKVLQAAGAVVYATGSNPLTTKDEIAAALVEDGIEVHAVYGADAEAYEQDLCSTLSCKPRIILDDGGDFVQLLHEQRKDLAESLIGGCEETTTGVLRLRARQRNNRLNFPMVAVNDAMCKHLFDNRYGTGQSVWDGIMRTTNLTVCGKTVVVAGYGWCGKGVSNKARGLGARVIVTEVDPVKAIEAIMDGFEVMPMVEAAALGDVFVTVTGCKDIITEAAMLRMKDGALLANAGHFDVEISKPDLNKLAVRKQMRRQNIEGFTFADGRTINLLADGRLVNLASGDGHPAEIMDMSFALQALSLLYLHRRGEALQPKVYAVPPEIDARVASMKLGAQGVSIDALSEEQSAYLQGWQ